MALDWRARAREIGGLHRPVRILVVQDEPGVRALWTRLLDTCGYGVVEADSAWQAMEVLRAPEGDVQLAVVDLDLDGLCGELLVQHLRETRPTLPLIVLAARPDQALYAACMEAGVDILLSKPLPTLSTLAHAVASVCPARAA